MLVWVLFVIVGVLQSSTSKSFLSNTPSEKDDQDRLDCWLKDEAVDENTCKALGCLWDSSVADGVPYCFFPKAGYGYKVANTWSDYSAGFSVDLERFPAKSRFGFDVQRIKFDVKYYGQSIVRFKFHDPETKRYEVPIFKDLEKKEFEDIQPQSRFQIAYDDDERYGFQFQVIRTEGAKTTIFNSSVGGLTFSDQFLQLATYLPQGSSLYGIGENPHPSYKHDMNYKTWPLFSRDVSPVDGYQNVYGVHPFYMCVESDGRAHGLFFVNSNAMEFTTLPAPGVSIRTTGGILDVFLFVGNDPREVVYLYQQIIGKTFMPPYWALGFQLSRWGYKNTEDIEKVINRTIKAKVPYDVQYSDIDYMDQKKDFTWDHQNFKGMDKLMQTTKGNGLRWILILDPAILADDPSYKPYNDGKAQDLFIHWPSDIPVRSRTNPPDVDTTKGVIYGNVWPSGPVVFPDFFRNGTREWWKQSIALLYKDLKFDGLWIDMNEPSNFDTNRPIKKGDPWHLSCPTNKYDDPAYLPLAARTWGRDIRLSEKTICMASVQGDQDQYRHYDVHSLYGWSETEPSIRAARDLTGERSIVFSRSTYASSGQHGGHWLGDNFSRWVDLHRSIIGMLEFNLFGIPYIGADICGFNDKADKEMCLRWMQLGAFYPLSRNHNTMGTPDQDPAAWDGEVTEAIKRALNTRYRLLPYLYTLFHEAHTRGDKVLNALVDLYPTDKETHGIDTQFLWGEGLLISPVLNKGQKSVDVYLPDDNWYDYYTGMLVWKQQGKGTHLKVTNLDDIPLHVRGGNIFAAQDPAVNTRLSRQNPFSLLTYPGVNEFGGDLMAFGEIFWDDGVSIDSVERKDYLHFTFTYSENKFQISSQNRESTFKDEINIRDIKIYNTTTDKDTATVNGKTSVPITKDEKGKSITIKLETISLSKDTRDIDIEW